MAKHFMCPSPGGFLNAIRAQSFETGLHMGCRPAGQVSRPSPLAFAAHALRADQHFLLEAIKLDSSALAYAVEAAVHVAP